MLSRDTNMDYASTLVSIARQLREQQVDIERLQDIRESLSAELERLRMREFPVGRHRFKNGYGASVIEDNLFDCPNDRYEIGVLDSKGNLCITTEVATGGVLRNCTIDDVTDTLNKIERL